jgi:hypothetical protein
MMNGVQNKIHPHSEECHHLLDLLARFAATSVVHIIQIIVLLVQTAMSLDRLEVFIVERKKYD